MEFKFATDSKPEGSYQCWLNQNSFEHKIRNNILKLVYDQEQTDHTATDTDALHQCTFAIQFL